MFTIGNDELEKLPPSEDFAVCPHCEKLHKIEYGDKVEEDGTHTSSRLLGFVQCEEESYLVAVAGKLLKPPKSSTRLGGNPDVTPSTDS